jgi:hypothetical protein
MNREDRGFTVRGTQECGWNLFRRKGYSDSPWDISVNHAHLDHLARAGVNWLMVFWTNSAGFDAAWREAVDHAHRIGLKLSRAIYGFSGGGPETTMAEPDAPPHLLRPSSRGPATALCPQDGETLEWFGRELRRRLDPGVDGILIEPAREIGRDCACPKCRALHPYAWDVLVINWLTDRIREIRPDAEVFLHLSTRVMATERDRLREEYARVRGSVRHMFAWGADDEPAIADWLDLDPRFEHFAKLGRVLLFPDGRMPDRTAEERVARVFRWVRMSAERGKEGFTFDYRIFGGKEWQGHEAELPSTRVSSRMPASLGVMGAAMLDPCLEEEGQRALLDRLRVEADWDLDDPAHFWRGATWTG